MHNCNFGLLLGACAALALAGCDRADRAPQPQGNASETANASDAHPTDPMESAMAAAPASVSRDAAIVQAQPDGSMKTLREGNNGWTCMADNPTTPGPDPMCMDKNAGTWAAAWMGKKTPPTEAPGVMYMLAGGTDASNLDPYSERPRRGEPWVQTGPHLMVVGSDSLLTSYPSGQRPDTRRPYVMWAGTPYAHLMIPVR